MIAAKEHLDNNRKNRRYPCILLIFCISSLPIPFITINFDVVFQAFVLLVQVAIIMKGVSHLGGLHPLSWFSPFFYLYAVSYPLYQFIIGYQDRSLDYIIPLHHFAYISFAIGVLVLRQKAVGIPSIKKGYNSVKYVHYFAIFFSVALLFYTFLLGAGSKREFFDITRGLGISNLYLVFTFISITSGMLYIVNLNKYGYEKRLEILKSKKILSVFLILVLAFGLTGERDYIFRFIIIFLMIYFGTLRKYKIVYILVPVLLLFIFMPFSHELKAFIAKQNFIIALPELKDFFYGEFYAPGRNLHYVINMDVGQVQRGDIYINAIKRYFSFIFTDANSSTEWFNKEVRAWYGDSGSSGWGFSLVAQAYLYAHWVGVFSLFFLVGFISSIVAKYADKNHAGYLFYLLYIPTLIYVTRADLSNYLSLVFKVNLFMIILLVVMCKFLDSYNKRRAFRL